MKLWSKVKEIRAKNIERRYKPWSAKQKIVFLSVLFVLTAFSITSIIYNSNRATETHNDGTSSNIATSSDDGNASSAPTTDESATKQNVSMPHFHVGTVDIVLIVGICGFFIVKKIKKKKEK